MMMIATQTEALSTSTRAISAPETSSLSAVVSRKEQRGREGPSAGQVAVDKVRRRRDRKENCGSDIGPISVGPEKDQAHHDRYQQDA